MSFKMKFVPLTFISSKEAVETQLRNSAVFKVVYEKFKRLVALSTLIERTQYGYTASAKANGEHKLLRITDINNGFVNWNSVPFCNCDVSSKYLLESGDILIARTGNNISYLVSNDVPANSVFASYLIRIVCNQTKLLPEYLFLFLNSYAFWHQILLKQRGALLQNVNAKLMGQLLVPMCSIEEQREIIENRKSAFDGVIIQEIDSIVSIHNYSHSLSKEHIHQLALLKKLRQSLLQDAVQGKLVAQDASDEPAEVLLKRIKAEKEAFIAARKLKKDKLLPPIREEEISFAIPEGWVWCRLGEIALSSEGGKSLQANAHPATENKWGVLKTSAITSGQFIESENKRFENTSSQYENILVKKDDMLFCRASGSKGLAGTSCIVREQPRAKLILER